MDADTARRPRLAILFWYYTAPDVCVERLRRLRRLNPGVPVFGLYGGPPQAHGAFADVVRRLDDSWVFESDRDSYWKWRHGDLMIHDWFVARGGDLDWESIVVVQWDMLVCAPLERIFDPLLVDEIYLPGLRPLAEVSDFWWWVRPGTAEGRVFRDFERSLRGAGFEGDLWACQFITAVLPRRFLERYAALPPGELGFLEYKLPTLAKSFGLPFRDYPQLPVIWEADPRQPARIVLSARKAPIAARDILRELQRGRSRLFHPVTRRYRAGLLSVAPVAVAEMLASRFRRYTGRMRRALHQLGSVD